MLSGAPRVRKPMKGKRLNENTGCGRLWRAATRGDTVADSYILQVVYNIIEKKSRRNEKKTEKNKTSGICGIAPRKRGLNGTKVEQGTIKFREIDKVRANRLFAACSKFAFLNLEFSLLV